MLHIVTHYKFLYHEGEYSWTSTKAINTHMTQILYIINLLFKYIDYANIVNLLFRYTDYATTSQTDYFTSIIGGCENNFLH